MKTKPKNQHGGTREGSGRKPKHGEPTERVTVRLPVSIVAQLGNRTETILKALKQYLRPTD
jgi:hypothetical protein